MNYIKKSYAWQIHERFQDDVLLVKRLLIADDFYWKKEGELLWKDLAGLLDDVPDKLWVNGYSSYNGLNDRIPEDEANKLRNSLLFIQPDHLAISVNIEGAEFGSGKRKVRALFRLNDHSYKIAVTDPKIEGVFLK